MTRLSPSEVLELVDRRDGTALNHYISTLAWDTWEEHLETTYGDQDFSSWERYHKWFMARYKMDSISMLALERR